MSAFTEVLLEEGYLSTNELFRGWALLTALSRVDQYRAESERYEEKYGLSLRAFEQSLRTENEPEDFQKEEDLDDWLFAVEALKWWEAKVEELQLAASS